MKVAVAGAGSVGMAVAADLKAHDHDVLILEKEPEVVERTKAQLDVRWATADACARALRAAGALDVMVLTFARAGD